MNQQGALTEEHMALLAQPDFGELLSLYTSTRSALGPNPTDNARAIQLRALMGDEAHNPVRLFLVAFAFAVPAYLDAL